VTERVKQQSRPERSSQLDFFSDSMGFVTKLSAALAQCMKELTDALKPHDNMMSTALESVLLKAALDHYRKVQQFLSGELTETVGHQYLEDESILGSSDKMMFFMKEMNQELAKSKKEALNPFVVSKLNIPSIKIYNYPIGLKKDKNPYAQRKEDLDLAEGKSACIQLAETMAQDQKLFTKNVLSFESSANQRQSTFTLQVQVPVMLQLSCNSIEVSRLRQELMMCLTECKML
jgi:hypothetical protein